MKTGDLSLPFSLNRNLRTPLSTQLADGLRKAILSGQYRPGDILPSYQQLAQALGVSLRVPREAMADLVARNLVNPRPRVGCEVLPRGATTTPSSSTPRPLSSNALPPQASPPSASTATRDAASVTT